MQLATVARKDDAGSRSELDRGRGHHRRLQPLVELVEVLVAL